jgi:hypothetical protein
MIATERQWYMFWRGVADQINAGAQAIGDLNGLVTFGNHADRPDPEFATDGALYVEQDRGSVLYQNQGGVWQYIAGIMYGTLVPDQRPADLGPAADAGFQFRTNVDPAQAFTWSGADWIETTPIRYGTHAARLAATIANLVSGMLWMETDRGSVIYQNQGGTWIYLAGTMWDTMSPDHRPTDLGVHDAGFDYRATDPPPREFIWNQTAWVEVTNISGATGLTHPNVVTKVGAAGQIVEGGITDASAANSGKLRITAGGNIGVDSPNPLNKFTISNGGAGGLEINPSTTAGSATGAYLVSFDRVAGGYRDIFIDQGSVYTFFRSGGNVGVGIYPTFQFQLGFDSAGKPATSTWSVVSDIRLKQNIRPVKDDSLAILEKLDWVRYEYNGKADTPPGKDAIGLVAQVLQEQLPEAVRSTRRKLTETDDAETDLLAIDYHHIIVHSARAIQQLIAEVKRLGALIEKPA